MSRDPSFPSRLVASVASVAFARRPAGVVSAVLLAALLGACTVTPPRPAPPVIVTQPPKPQRQPELAAFKAVLSGAEAVPRADSGASGELVAVLNRKTGLLQWKLRFSELSGPVRSAHFHSPAMSGEVADPVVSVGRNIVSPYEGRAILTRRQRADLLAGQWYVNLRTARHPEGELRGQLIEQH